MTQNAEYGPIFKAIEAEAKQDWGKGWDMLGDRIQRAVLCEGALKWANRLDEVTDAEKIRKILWAAQLWAFEKTGY